MKKYVTVFCCLMAVSVLLINPQPIKGNTNTEKSSVSEQASLKKTGSEISTTGEEQKKVLMHYMGWYGSDSLGRHWEYGQPRKPLIGYYNSQNWATQMYHILLSWSCGIDGLVINVKDQYDSLTLERLMPTLKSLREIDSTKFNYKFAISYDDQGMDVVGTDTAETKFKYLRDKILLNNPNYLRYNDTAVIFIFNYKKNIEKNIPEYLTARQYDSILNIVFETNRPKLIWNESDENDIGYVDVCYPWVQPYDTTWDRKNGLEWGKRYLEDFFWRIDSIPIKYKKKKLDFACSAVWPGFDDRRNTEWGNNRWMERRDGEVYDSTWIQTFNYNKPLPLKWAYIETWNDWNEGSEIEPSKEFGYKYLKSTIKNINAFKDPDVTEDTCKFLAALKIYEAADHIKRNPKDSATYYPCFKKSVKYFILNQCDSAIIKANQIIDSDFKCGIGSNKIELNHDMIEIYPNPAKDKLFIRQQNTDPYTLQLTDIQGKVMLNKQGNRQLETIDVSNFPKGIYLVRVKQNDSWFEKKIVVP
jgi:hypothetical protein